MVLRPRTIAASLAMAASAGFLFSGYEFVRSTSYSLYERAYGTAALPYVIAGSPLGVLLVTYLYGRLVSWLRPRRTLMVTTLASGVAMAICALAIHGGSKGAAAALYVVREAYIVLLIAQYWSFLNSTVSRTEAKILYGAVAGVASLGSITGAWLVSVLAIPEGTLMLVYLAAITTLPAALLSDLAFRFGGEPSERGVMGAERSRGGAGGDNRGVMGHLGLAQFKAAPVLIFILLVVIATQVVAGALEIHWRDVLASQVPNIDQRTAYTGQVYVITNIAAASCQFLLAPLLLRLLPLRAIHLAIPAADVIACVAGFLRPSAFAVSGAYVVFKALDYSLFTAAKEMLYMPLSFAARYRAKGVVDVFGYRFAKGGVALVAALLDAAKVAYDPLLTPAAIGAGLVWFGLAVPLTRRWRSTDQENAVGASSQAEAPTI